MLSEKNELCLVHYFEWNTVVLLGVFFIPLHYPLSQFCRPKSFSRSKITEVLASTHLYILRDYSLEHVGDNHLKAEMQNLPKHLQFNATF